MIESPTIMLLKEFQYRVQFITRKLIDGELSVERAHELENKEREAFAHKLNELGLPSGLVGHDGVSR